MGCNKANRIIESDIHAPIKVKNKRYFRNYFIQTWCKSNLSHDFYKFIKELNITDVAFKNKKVVSFINHKYKISISKLEEQDKNNEFIYKEFLRIVDQNTNYYDISLGDVIFVINSIKDKFIDVETQTLVFAIKTMYTFFLEEYINDWKLNISSYISSIAKINKSIEVNGDVSSYCKVNPNENINIEYPNYLVLIGGNFYNANEYNRILSLSKTYRECLYKDIPISDFRLRRIFKTLLNPLKSLNKEKRSKQIFALEFICLFFQNRFNVQYRYIEDKYIESSSFNESKLNVFSFFSNLLNIILMLLVEGTKEKNENSLTDFLSLIREISKERGTVFYSIMKKIYVGVSQQVIDKKIVEVINVDNYQVIINNIYEIINEFSFSNIEVLEYSMLNSRVNQVDILEKNIFNYISNVVFKKYKIEGLDIDDKIKLYSNFRRLYFCNVSEEHDMENRLRFNFVTPFDTPIEATGRVVILNDKNTGLYKAVLEDLYFPSSWSDKEKYSVYSECLQNQIDKTKNITRIKFDKVNLEKLYRDIKEMIAKNK